MVESHDALDAAARRAKVAEGARDDAARRAERAEARLAAEEERAAALDLANHGLSARVKEVEGERDEAATKLTAAAFDAEEGRRRVAALQAEKDDAAAAAAAAKRRLERYQEEQSERGAGVSDALNVSRASARALDDELARRTFAERSPENIF